MIQCDNVYKSFSGKRVLSGIHFEIPEGKIFGLLGPSGAGKTTLIRILTGQLTADSGSVVILNKEADQLTGEDKKKMGIMMDQFGVYERLSCEDNLKIFADIYQISHDRIPEILDLVGLKEAQKKSAAYLSKGMRARRSPKRSAPSCNCPSTNLRMKNGNCNCNSAVLNVSPSGCASRLMTMLMGTGDSDAV